MKLKKKVLCVVISIILLSCFAITTKGYAEESNKDVLYMQGKYLESEELLEVDVYVKTSNADIIQGIIMYDSTLELKKIEKFFPADFKLELQPPVSATGEVTSEIKYQTIEQGKKGIVFAAVAKEEDKFSGTQNILKLYFDISNCEVGKEYPIKWYTDDISGDSEPTRIAYQKTTKEITTSGYNVKIVDGEENNGGTDADAEAKAAAEKEAAEKAAKEAAEKEAAEKAAKEAAEKQAAEKAAKEAAEKEAADKAAKEATAKNANKVSNTAAENKENLPQTGSAYIYIIAGSIMLAISFGAIALTNIKKIKA